MTFRNSRAGWLMISLEGVAITTLVLIIAGLVRDLCTVSMPWSLAGPSIPLLAGAVILAATSAVRWVAGRTSYRWLAILGIGLVGMGGLLAFLAPGFFTEALLLDLPFWHRVCWYTLPAVCTEGGLLTLFTALNEKGLDGRTPRERLLLRIAFFAYSAAIVSANFLVLNGVLLVAGHVLVVRVMSVAVILTSCVLIAQQKKVTAQER